MPARHRKLEHVDVFAFLRVVEKRGSGNGFSSNGSDCFNVTAPGLNELYVAQTGFHAEG